MEYIKPMIYDNEEIAEGVYATGSGSDLNCWRISHSVSQRNVNEYDPFVNFRIKGEHIAQHCSKAVEIVLMMNAPAKSAVFDFKGFECQVDGMTIRLKRINHANGFGSLDNFDTNLRVVTDAPAYIDIIGVNWQCEKE